MRLVVLLIVVMGLTCAARAGDEVQRFALKLDEGQYYVIAWDGRWSEEIYSEDPSAIEAALNLMLWDAYGAAWVTVWEIDPIGERRVFLIQYQGAAGEMDVPQAELLPPEAGWYDTPEEGSQPPEEPPPEDPPPEDPPPEDPPPEDPPPEDPPPEDPPPEDPPPEDPPPEDPPPEDPPPEDPPPEDPPPEDPPGLVPDVLNVAAWASVALVEAGKALVVAAGSFVSLFVVRRFLRAWSFILGG